MMMTPEDRVRHYRLRAEEIRTAAADSHNSDTRATFLRIARDYELMAENVETQHKLRRHGESAH
jgi:IS1 family transposase